MSETKQTRCPFCNSVFNITDVQLAARGGHVRCGSCLQVFRADQNLVSGQPVTPTGTPPAAPAPAPAKPAAPVAPESEKPMSPPIVARTQSSAAVPGDQPIGQRKKKKLEDESWAFNLIGDDGEELRNEVSPKPEPVAEPPRRPAEAPPKTKKPMFDDELSDMLHEAWQDEPAKTGHQLKGPGEVEKITEAADDSWAQALLSEIAEEEKKEQSKNYSMEVVPPAKSGSREAPRKSPPPAPTADQGRQKHADQPREKATNNADDDLLNFLNSNSAPTLSQNAATLPVEVRHQRHLSINWSYYLTWSFLCLIALAGLVAQYVYFNFDKLSIDANTRPRMIALCETLKCKVPEPPDVSLLAIQKLVVRKHSQAVNGLQVDAILYNKANFTQPLPSLKLVLMNRKGEIVAGRLFKPREYLSQDYSNLRRIPPETPIHIELALTNPSVPFTGYKMQAVF